jgi:hypothetical protein
MSERFDDVVRNAFDFLVRSIDELERYPKYSVIHFYSAIELFVKARLLKEHWTLIVAKPDVADKAKFQRGDFQSVGLKDANERLTKITADGLLDEELKCFDGLRQERNQMVHFAHAAQGDGDAAAKEMDRIRNSSKSPCRWRRSTSPARARSPSATATPATLHLWWARRPLAAARAVIFAQMVDDPSAHPDLFPTEKAQEKERQRLFKIIEDLVKWENTTNETVLQRRATRSGRAGATPAPRTPTIRARRNCSTATSCPPSMTPSPAAGALPLEAQRLGLESYASDLNPVAVLINKAMIEIPPKFAGKPPVNPDGSAAEAAQMGKSGRARRAWPRTCATTASGCATRPRSASATSTPRSRSPPRWPERPDLKPYVGPEAHRHRLAVGAHGEEPQPGVCQRRCAARLDLHALHQGGQGAYVEPVFRFHCLCR